MTKDERKKLQEAKIRAKKAAEEKAAKKKTRGEVGEFGFGINTKMHLFCQSLSKAPKTMEQIKKEKWNDKGAKFNGRFNDLVKAGIAAKTKDGKMYIIGSIADPKKKKK